METRPQVKPAPITAAGVVQVARRLGRAATIRDLLTTPVLVPDITDYTVVTALDRAIVKHLQALAAVCHQPHDRLGVEHVLVWAPQARRVPVTGLVRLASHSEDWAGVEFNRVIPERLLAQRYIEDYDFYENQVAVQLVDRLRRYLGGRIRDLNSLRHHIADLTQYQEALEGHQSHWKRERLATLLAEAAEGSQSQSEPVKEALDRLADLARQVNLLRGSPLYRQANRRAMIPLRLPRTNLLSRDRRYHRTGTLWEAWALRAKYETGAAEEFQREFPAAYVAYVMAIILRAYGILGLTPANADLPPAGENPVDICTDDGVRLRTCPTGNATIEVSSGGVVIARVIALAENITGEPSAARVRATLDRVFQGCQSADIPTIIAYPGELSERAELPPKLRRLVHWTGPFPDGSGAPPDLFGVVPVTPLEIESTERMARALRWAWYATGVLAAYPPHIQAPAGSRISQRDWLRVHPRHWELLRPPTPAELAQLHTELSEHRGGPSRSSSPALEATAVHQVSSELRRAEDVIRRLMACPLCRKTKRVSFKPKDRGTFRCLCADCGGQWGTRICGARQHVFPVLTDGKPASTDADDSDQDPFDTGDKIDARFGSDVLALPCPSFPDWTRFRCPWCGICQGSPSCRCNLCDATLVTPGSEGRACVL